MIIIFCSGMQQRQAEINQKTTGNLSSAQGHDQQHANEHTGTPAHL